MSELRHWPPTPLSEILKLKDSDPARANQALQNILSLYYEPIRQYMLRNAPGDAHTAEDWAHEFVVKFAEGRLTRNWNPKLGQLRHYVTMSLRNFIRDKLRAAGRGPTEVVLRTALMSSCDVDPEAQFHREWACTLVERALARLTAEGQHDPGVEQELAVLRLRYGLDGTAPRSYEAIAEHWGETLQRHQIDNMLRRARRKMLEAMREEVRLLLESDDAADPELWRIADLL